MIVSETAGDRKSVHVIACEDRYLSYDRNTDKFFGFDGKHHYCML